MKFLFLGDIVGRAGRDAVVSRLKEIRQRLGLDFVVVNGENVAGGFGITPKLCAELYAAGADVITLGNHAWGQREIMGYINTDPRLLRPLNFPKGTPGKGAGVFTTERGKKVFVAQVLGRTFMDPLDDPFAGIDAELAKHRLAPGQGGLDFMFVDVHAEASSEKMAMAHFLDGRVTCVMGTHTHVPTADCQIFPNGTAYQTDAGMCGDYNSVIGMDKTEPLARFIKKIPGNRMEPATGEATVCGVFVESDDTTGLATRIDSLRVGGRLKEVWPA